MSQETPAANATESVAQGPKVKTTYIVLKGPVKAPANTATTSGPNGWTRVGEVEATSAEAAIRTHAENISTDGTTLDGSGTYVAIPARSWKPTTVTVETKTTLKLT